jgi:hypothetical protein
MEDSMAQDASVALGAPQVAGSMVGPRGLGRKMTGMAIGGLVGSAVAGIGSGGKQRGTPSFGRVAYLAVSADEVALVKTKSGLWKMKVSDDVLARRPRSDVALAELKGGVMASAVTIEFTDGDAWAFDVPRANKTTATQVVQALNGLVS